VTFHWRAALAVLGLAALALAAGCISREPLRKQRYAFDVDRTGAAAGPGRGVLQIGSVAVAPVYERKTFVYRVGDDEYRSDFYNEFFAPPGLLIRETTFEWLGASGVFANVVQSADVPADWVLGARVLRLYGDLRDKSGLQSVMEIEFTLLRRRIAGSEIALQKVYAARVPVPERNAERVFAGWGEGLARILSEFEGDLRAAVSRSGAAGP
jgi:cholesterol transport system auxiliary component